MKILFVITFLSFLALALALFLVARHIRKHGPAALEPAEAFSLPQLKSPQKTRRRSTRRKPLRVAA